MSISKEIQKIEEIKRRILARGYLGEKDSTLKNSEAKDSKAKNSEKASIVETKVVCRVIRGKFRYYIDQKYVCQKKYQNLLEKAVIAEYHKKLLPVIEKLMVCLKNALAIEKELTDIYDQMHEGKRVLFRPDIVPVSKLIEEFENETYEGLGFDENDHTEYFTNRGERVRSKSEKIIADELYRRGIPYKYEKPLSLNTNGKIKDFYPDFTVMNINTGEIRYIEHLGMLDQPYYFQNVLAKLDAFEKNGLLIGRDVILLHESAYRPLNTRVIADYIDEFLT